MLASLDMNVNTGRYTGHIHIKAEQPGVYVILSSDTRFLEYAVRKIDEDRSCVKSKSSEKKRSRVSIILKQDRVIEGLTAAENIFLNTREGLLYSPSKREKACEELFMKIGFYLSPSARVGELTASQRRFVEFYRALYLNPEVFIAEEVTASLSYREVVYFNTLLNAMKEQGTCIFFFTTRWEEAVKVGDWFHVYIDGAEHCVLTRKEVQDDPQSLYFMMMDIDPRNTKDESEEDYRKWIDIISQSMEIENQLTRINTVLDAYCSRLMKLADGQACRIYLYRDAMDELICLASQTVSHPDYGRMKEEDLRLIMQTSTMHISDNRESGYEELFDTPHIPSAVLSYTMKKSEGSWLCIQIATNASRRVFSESRLDSLHYISIEILIFVENSRLRGQAAILQESNHRIKNNMQMILSYIMLQRDSLKNKITDAVDRCTADNAFQEINDRILAIYKVHELMSRGNILEGNAELADVATEIGKIYDDYTDITVTGDDLRIPARLQLPFCVILNEMMNNTVKHNAFVGEKIQVTVSVLADDDSIRLLYHDNGIGTPGKKADDKGNSEVVAGSEKPWKSYGIGMKLIRLTVMNDLKGMIETDGSDGYTISIVFPKWEDE